jgi:hypothetical protein
MTANWQCDTLEERSRVPSAIGMLHGTRRRCTDCPMARSPYSGWQLATADGS